MAETTVSQVQKRGERFHLTTSRGAVEGESLVVATGGPSIPKMGASGYAYDLARQFGVAVVLPRPALVPFTFDPAVLEKLRPRSEEHTSELQSLMRISYAVFVMTKHKKSEANIYNRIH